MKRTLFLFFAAHLTGCASVSVSKSLSMVSFEDTPAATPPKSIGSIEGRDCTWSVMGYWIGEPPSIQKAFKSAATQKEQSLIPGQEMKANGPALKAVKNISVETGGFNAYVASRSCVIVTGLGLQ